MATEKNSERGKTIEKANAKSNTSNKEPETDRPFFLSPIDNTIPTAYSPKLLFFPVPNDHTDIAIESFLHGLRSTFQVIPLLAGTIKARPDGTGQVGTLAVTSPWRRVDEIFQLRDRRKCKKYRYSELSRKGFPPVSLPMWDFVQLGFYTDSNPPAMHVQITLIQGGLVLAPCVHHNFIDGTGLAVILERWAASCRGETILPEQISILWQGIALPEGHDKVAWEEFPEYTYGKKRHFMNMRSFTESDEQRDWLSRSRLASEMRESFRRHLKPMLIKLLVFGITNCQSLIYSNRFIYFSYADLAKLKESVQAAGEESDQKNWISTLDTVSALLFCCVAQSRAEAKHGDFACSNHGSKMEHHPLLTKTTTTRWLHHIVPTPFLPPSPSPPQASAQFITSVNIRQQCQFPPNYIRNMFLPCSIQTPLHELRPSTRNVAAQARKLRARIRTFDGSHVGRVVSMVRSLPDVGKIECSAGDSLRNPLTMSSWREQGFCDLDWGPHIGAKCERVRICNFFFDGLVVVFPEYSGSKIDGGIEMVLGLRKDAMRKLEKNEFFNQFAQWR